MTDTYSVLDTEQVLVPMITPTANGIAFNPTGLVVEMAFISGTNDPQSGDWNPATWQSTRDYLYAVACYIGPAGVTLTAGKYWPWVKIATSPGPLIKRSLGMITVS